MIRLILIAIFVILYHILGLPVLGILWIWGKFNKPASDLASLRIVQWAFRVILFLAGTEITVIGEEHVPKDQAVLYIANHQSYFDIVLTYARCPNLTGFVAKDSIQKIPILPIWMHRLYCLFLNRDDIREGMKTILAGIDQLKRGISVFIFPEGTRNDHPEELLPFKEGSFKLALKSGCPVIPIAITNSCQIYERQAPFVKKTHVVIQYGAPINPADLDGETKKHIGEHSRELIAKMLEDNQNYL